jgi:hypothetical protein
MYVYGASSLLNERKIQTVRVKVWTLGTEFTRQTAVVPWENTDLHKLLVPYAYTTAPVPLNIKAI